MIFIELIFIVEQKMSIWPYKQARVLALTNLLLLSYFIHS